MEERPGKPVGNIGFGIIGADVFQFAFLLLPLASDFQLGSGYGLTIFKCRHIAKPRNVSVRYTNWYCLSGRFGG